MTDGAEQPRADGVGAGATGTGTSATTRHASPVNTGLNTDVLGHRFAALFIDSVLVYALVWVVAALLNVGFLGFMLLFTVGSFAYFIIPEAHGGQTPGKMALGIRVVSEDGSPITDGQAVSRNVWRFIDGIGYYLVGIIFAASSSQNQRLGDRQAGTLVVKDSG